MDAHAPSTPWTILSIPWSGTSPSNPSINQATTRRANVSDFAADFLCGIASGTGIGKHLSSTPSPMIAANNLKKRLLSVLSITQFAARHSVAEETTFQKRPEAPLKSKEKQYGTFLLVHIYIYIYIIYLYIPAYLLYVVYVTYTWGNLWCAWICMYISIYVYIYIYIYAPYMLYIEHIVTIGLPQGPNAAERELCSASKRFRRSDRSALAWYSMIEP